VGVTANVAAFEYKALTITKKTLVTALVGTVTVMLVHWVGVATNPPSVTTLAPWLAPKLLPAIVTVVPSGPVAGERLTMVGGTSPVTVKFA
jgi:hypothetical protein